MHSHHMEMRWWWWLLWQQRWGELPWVAFTHSDTLVKTAVVHNEMSTAVILRPDKNEPTRMSINSLFSDFRAVQIITLRLIKLMFALCISNGINNTRKKHQSYNQWFKKPSFMLVNRSNGIVVLTLFTPVILSRNMYTYTTKQMFGVNYNCFLF